MSRQLLKPILPSGHQHNIVAIARKRAGENLAEASRSTMISATLRSPSVDIAPVEQISTAIPMEYAAEPAAPPEALVLARSPAKSRGRLRFDHRPLG